ncbi:MAG: hypothetical protein RI935_101 [Candidatus Parcubacteria bacterium]|jgi:cysteinyl-tRNA synthetase
MSIITLYTTNSRKEETFTPLNKDSVHIYSCGPTVYHYAHIGNLRAYVFADVLRRMFSKSGYTVKHVINITDVGHMTSDGDTGEDKLEKGSRREGKSAFEVALFYEEAFKKDLGLLNIPLKEYLFPRATEYIQEQINLIEKLESKGHTYRIDDDGIYFDTSTFKEYKDLAQLDIEHLRSGARVEENPLKKNKTDFALWKFSPKGFRRQMEWESPWGVGFPGWHIECSAMSKALLGTTFDIHTGGIDHIPVHHTNEIAQSVCANDAPYVKYWMHVNFLHDKTGKMSKSNDDFLTLDSIIQKGYDPMVYRYFVLTAHYRKELSFSYEALQASKMAYNKLSSFVINNKKNGSIIPSSLNAFLEALQHDLRTPEAIAQMWSLMQSDYKKEDISATLKEMGDMLGIIFKDNAIDEKALESFIAKLVQDYKKAKIAKDYATSDTIRERLKKEGYTVQDEKDGGVKFFANMEVNMSGSSSLKTDIDTEQ